MRAGELASNVHRAVAQTFAKHGFALGHLSGHSIGATMLEYPAIGAKSDVPLEENMIFSLHPQVVDTTARSASIPRTLIASAKPRANAWPMFPGSFTPDRESRNSDEESKDHFTK